MADIKNYLSWNVPIVDPKTGNPTPEFIRFLQMRAIADNQNVPGSRRINTTPPLTGGGDLTGDLTLGWNAGLGDLNDVNLSPSPTNGQVIVYDAGTSTWKPADQSGGGGGGGGPVFVEPALIQSATDQGSSGARTITLSSAPVAGHYLLLVIESYNGATFTPPTGFQLLTQANNGDSGFRAFYKVATGSEGTSLSYTVNDQRLAVLFELDQMDAFSITSQALATTTAISQTTFVPPQGASGFLVWMLACNSAAGATVSSPTPIGSVTYVAASAHGGGCGWYHFSKGTYTGTWSATPVLPLGVFFTAYKIGSPAVAGSLPPWVAPVAHVPQVSDFTVLNAGTAGTFTTTNQTFGIDFFATDDGGTEQVKALGMSLVDQTFTLAVRMYALMIPANYSVFGIGVRDSSTGQMVTMCLDCRGATVPRYRVTTRSSFTSAIANPIDLNAMHLCEYFRIVSDGTNRSWEISLDGRQWIPLGTTTIASYASGANQIFWWVSAADAANRPLRGSLVDWNYVP